MTKQNIINNIHTLVSHNVIGDKQLINRYKGFKGELSFEAYLKHKYNKYELLDGGMIFSIDSLESSINNGIYITVTDQINNIEDYKNIYASLSDLSFKKLFLVIYENTDWKNKPVMVYTNETISLPVPSLKIMTFDVISKQFLNTDNTITQFTSLFEDLPVRKKSSYPIDKTSKDYLFDALNTFDINDLIKIYLNRLFLDGYIGFGKQKGKISDIDLILKRPHGAFRLIEIKEKDLAKKIIGFGLDTPRLEDMNRIMMHSKLNYYLTVRHINNQKDRKLVGWKMISINDFSKNVKGQKTTEGGTGMRSIKSNNPTVICELEHFTEI